MPMTRNSLTFIAASGSFVLLAGAFLFQALGYAPCAMCLWQRWPHAVAIGIGLLALAMSGKRLGGILVIAGALAAATTAAIGLYHTGVERDWWEGPSSCTSASGGLGDLSGADLLAMDGPALILCDQVAWAMMGISMASWNAIFSLFLVAIWIMAARRPA